MTLTHFTPGNLWRQTLTKFKISRLQNKRVSILSNVSRLFKSVAAMSSLKVKTSLKRAREPSSSGSRAPLESLPDIAIAAIVSSKRQKDVSEFISFLLKSLERNSHWLNSIVGRQSNFRCALLVGSGPNRFQIQEIIYPSEGKNIKLEVELKESEDHDKIAIAALLKLTNLEMNHLIEYTKTRLYDNSQLREDLLDGKALGIDFAFLRPISDKQYRIMERIVIGASLKCVLPLKKRRDERSPARTLVKKAKRVA